MVVTHNDHRKIVRVDRMVECEGKSEKNRKMRSNAIMEGSEIFYIQSW